MTDEWDVEQSDELPLAASASSSFVQVQPFRFELSQFAANLTLAQQCFEPILAGAIVTMRFGKRVFTAVFHRNFSIRCSSFPDRAAPAVYA